MTTSQGGPRPRRGAEAGLLVLAWLGAGLALAQIDWVATNSPLPGPWITLGAIVVLSSAMHVVVRWKAPYADQIMLPVATLLTSLGLTMIARLDVAAARSADQQGGVAPSPDVYAQLTWFGIAAILFIATIILMRDHRRLQRYTYTLGLTGLVLLVLPLVPIIGTTVNGATLWIRLGSFSFQPGEIAKILLTASVAGYLVVKRESLSQVRVKVLGVGLPRPRDVGPLIAAWLVSLAILVFERDLGTSLLFFGIFVGLLYIATQRPSWLVMSLGLFLIGSLLAVLSFGHVRSRVAIWLDPWAQADGAGYQVVQSLYGFANGGLLGTGLGQGFPNYVPFASTDFIIAAFAEELGLVGVVAIIVLYGVLVERGLRTAIEATDPYGKLLAAGLAIALGLQSFIIMAGVSRLIPLTGLTTPFMSYGGSSLIANWIIVAILLRVSDRARRPPVSPVNPAEAATTVLRTS
jgi:cell division protein FtsW (lipid II flippase)